MHSKHRILLLFASMAQAQNLVMMGMGVYEDDTDASPIEARQALGPPSGGSVTAPGGSSGAPSPGGAGGGSSPGGSSPSRPSTCASGQESCDSTCIKAGATCCRLGNNAFCDAGEYCTGDNTCCPLGQGCPGPGECKAGTVRCGIGCIPAGFTCCTDHYCL
jgi:hypothetical protein